MPTEGVLRIAAERDRQIAEEGYDARHDAGHAGELAMAGAAYANAEFYRDQGYPDNPDWPWDQQYWKPSPDNRIRELVKAGALIAAAIDAELAGE